MEQENNTKRAGRRRRGGEGGEERNEINYKVGLNCWVAREGRPPGMAWDCQAPRHRMAVGLDESTERNRHRWRCSVVVPACREEGTTRKKARRKKNANDTPQHQKVTGPKRVCG